MEWKLIYNGPNHRLFKQNFANGIVSIADQSGDTPDRTDDGPLLVQHPSIDRCPVLEYRPDGAWGGFYVTVPVWVTRSKSIGYVSLTLRDFSVLRALCPAIEARPSESARRVLDELCSALPNFEMEI